MSVRTVGGFTQGDVCEVLWGDEDQVPEWWDAQVIAISLKNVTVKFLTSEALISDDPEVLMWAQMTPRFSCLLPVSEVESKLVQGFLGPRPPLQPVRRHRHVEGERGSLCHR
jgi:hypothetical protein